MARLLQLAGPRPDAPPERAQRVREAVLRAWESNRRRRVINRRTAVAATFLTAAALLALVVMMPRGPLVITGDEVLATGERIEGVPRLGRSAAGRRITLALARDTPVRSADLVETDSVSRVALRTVEGGSVRLDRASRARLVSRTAIDLVEGAVYIDTPDGSRGFEVRTPLGTLHDIGTQFEVRLGAASVRLRVRTGAVEIRRGDTVIPARAGTEATITSHGVDSRRVSTYGSEWEWTAGLALPFAIEGRPLASFLDHLSREQGWALRYVDAPLAEAASAIVLHGSVDGLKAHDAVDVVIATSGLKYRVHDGELLVYRPEEPQ